MIFEGMYYLNRKGIIHRNIKPNSIYLYSKTNKHDLSDSILQLGDYGILTIMKDARTKTRIPPGAFDYIAPEVIDSQEYNEKSDVWALGCILLDMATTALYDVISKYN
jgi:serine/threonine kinase-like domain-containing protein STKLD1